MKLITTLILSAITLVGFSQEGQNAFKPSDIEEVKDGSKLIEVARIPVSETTVAYTFKLNSIKTNLQGRQDLQGSVEQSEENKTIINLFLEVKDVFECTFDDATQTFTVLTGPTVELSEVIEKINKN